QYVILLLRPYRRLFQNNYVGQELIRNGQSCGEMGSSITRSGDASRPRMSSASISRFNDDLSSSTSSTESLASPRESFSCNRSGVFSRTVAPVEVKARYVTRLSPCLGNRAM